MGPENLVAALSTYDSPITRHREWSSMTQDGTASWLATFLDLHMVQQLTVIVPPETPDKDLPVKSPDDVLREIGNRYLLHYVVATKVGQFRNGSPDPSFVTPTPYSPEETVRWLATPRPTWPRTHVLLIDPRRMSDNDVILGPRFVLAGGGIEYLLPNGFGPHALALRWEMEVR